MFGAISRAESVDALLTLLGESSAPLSAPCVCHAIYYLGRLLQQPQRKPPSQDALRRMLSGAVISFCTRDGELQGRDVSKAAWGLAKACTLDGQRKQVSLALEALAERAAKGSLDPAAVAGLAAAQHSTSVHPTSLLF